jgi:hypothetical protein
MLTEDQKREQEDMVLGEMTLINRVVELLLRKEGSELYGEGKDWSEEERGVLERCVFDLRCVRLREKGEGQGEGEEEGGVEGEPICGYCDPEGERCEECEARERVGIGGGGVLKGDCEEEWTRSEMNGEENEGDEKDRHDSGVGIEGEEMATKGTEAQNAGENGRRKEADSSIDDEEGGVRLDIFYGEVSEADAKTSKEEEGYAGHAAIGNEKERVDAGDEKTGKQEEERCVIDEEVPQATKYAVSDRDFGLTSGREHMKYDSD